MHYIARLARGDGAAHQVGLAASIAVSVHRGLFASRARAPLALALQTDCNLFCLVRAAGVQIELARLVSRCWWRRRQRRPRQRFT